MGTWLYHRGSTWLYHHENTWTLVCTRVETHWHMVAVQFKLKIFSEQGVELLIDVHVESIHILLLMCT